jgi:hypothetical protein
MSIWKREYAGRYVNRKTGWVIEKSVNTGLWYVINPETGGVFDSFVTKAEAQKYY